MLETFFYIVCPKTTNAINNIASEYRPTIRNALKILKVELIYLREVRPILVAEARLEHATSRL